MASGEAKIYREYKEDFLVALKEDRSDDVFLILSKIKEASLSFNFSLHIPPYNSILAVIESENIAALHHMIENNAFGKVFSIDNEGNTVAHHLLAHKMYDEFKKIVKNNPAYLNEPNADEETPFHKLLNIDDPHINKNDLLSFCMDCSVESASQKNTVGITPMHILASSPEYNELFLSLLEIDSIDCKTKDHQGYTSIGHALFADNYELLDDILKKYPHKVSPEDILSQFIENDDLARFKAYLQDNLFYTNPTKELLQELPDLAEKAITEDQTRTHEFFKELIKIKNSFPYRFTQIALNSAIKIRDGELVDFILTRYKDKLSLHLNYKNAFLHNACIAGDSKIYHKLVTSLNFEKMNDFFRPTETLLVLKHGEDPCVERPPLTLAVFAGNFDIVRSIVSKSKNPLLCIDIENNNNNPLFAALVSKDQMIAKYLLENGFFVGQKIFREILDHTDGLYHDFIESIALDNSKNITKNLYATCVMNAIVPSSDDNMFSQNNELEMASLPKGRQGFLF